MLVGNGIRLLYKSSPDIVPGAGFTNVKLGFAPSASWHVGTTTGALASAADFQSALGNVSGLFIRGEYTVGGELAGLDNVRLIGVPAVPEPSSLFLLLLGCWALGGFGLARRQREPDA